MANICGKLQWNPKFSEAQVTEISRRAKNFLDLATTLTFYFWPWKPFQWWPLTWRSFCTKWHWLQWVKRSVLMDGRTAHGRPDDQNT